MTHATTVVVVVEVHRFFFSEVLGLRRWPEMSFLTPPPEKNMDKTRSASYIPTG